MSGLWGCLRGFGVSQEGSGAVNGILGLPGRVLELLWRVLELSWGFPGDFGDSQECPEAFQRTETSQVDPRAAPGGFLGCPGGSWSFPED